MCHFVGFTLDKRNDGYYLRMGGYGVSEQMIYIHYDTVGNNVLSKGITNQSSKNFLKRIPSNLLLIKGGDSFGTYDSHTGFPVIKGQEEVKKFLDAGIGRPSQLGAWVDFSSIDMLHQLTPVEISEILYIAHAHNYLYSPFYYKLQNNYIYLSLPNDFTKVYYRYLEEFYEQFADSITQRMQKKVNEKKRFFQKDKVIHPLQSEKAAELVPAFREGVCFSFRQIKIENQVYSVPMFITEDKMSTINQLFDEKLSVGMLIYDANKDQWNLQYHLD